MKKLLLCALLCAPLATSHAAVAAPIVAAPKTEANQLAWKIALAIDDVEAARQLVAAPGFAPGMKLEGWDKSLLYGVIENRRREIASLIIEASPANAFADDAKQLCRLGENENLPALRALLQRPDFDPNLPVAPDDVAPLIETTNESKVEGVRLLLANPRTDVNARDAAGQTALLLPGSESPEGAQIVALLLADKRCDATAFNAKGDNALHLAASHPTPQTTLEAMLLDARIPANAKNKAGLTPLEVAVKTENLLAVEEIMALRKLNVPAAFDAKIRALRAKKGVVALNDNQKFWLRIIAVNDLPAARQRVKRADFDPSLKLLEGDSILAAALAHDNPAMALLMMDAAKTEAYLNDDSPRNYLGRTSNLPVLQRFLSHADFNLNAINFADPLLMGAINAGNIEGVRATQASQHSAQRARSLE